MAGRNTTLSRRGGLYHRSPLSNRPNLFIIGAAKSGTTSLYEYLRGHPQIYMSVFKEPAYFSPDVRRRRDQFRLGRDDQAYLDLFADAGDALYRGEASTYYLPSREAPKLIREFEPQARLIVILRNPIDQMRSFHQHLASGDVESIKDFEAALAADLEPLRGGASRQQTMERVGTYRERARYGEQLRRWLDVFPRDQLHVILFEELSGEPAAELRKVLEFLGVASDYQPSSFAVHNPSSRRRSGPAGIIVRNRLNTWLVNHLVQPALGGRRTERLRRVMRKSSVNRAAVERRPVSPELRAELEAEFAEDVAAASKLVGRDLDAIWFGRTTAAEAEPAAGAARLTATD